ncbi:MAG: RNA-binding protein [Candidatus Zixiibacteriota bacterium]
MKLFVGNLPLEATDDDLRQAFEPFGEVVSAAIVREKYSTESRGFGFVDMRSQEEAQSAIDAMNDKEWMGRTLTVNEARPRPQQQRGGFGKGGRRRQDSRRRGGKRGGGKRRSGWGF